jgi:hypothetical protein
MDISRSLLSTGDNVSQYSTAKVKENVVSCSISQFNKRSWIIQCRFPAELLQKQTRKKIKQKNKRLITTNIKRLTIKQPKPEIQVRAPLR